MYSTAVADPFVLLKAQEFRKQLDGGKYSSWLLNVNEKFLYVICHGLSKLGKEPDSPLANWAKEGGHTDFKLTPSQREGLKMIISSSREPMEVEEDPAILKYVNSERKLFGVAWEIGGLSLRVGLRDLEDGSLASLHPRAIMCLINLALYAFECSNHGFGNKAAFMVGGCSHLFQEDAESA